MLLLIRGYMHNIIDKWLKSNYVNFQNKTNGFIHQTNGESIKIGANEVNHIVDWLRSPDATRHRQNLTRLSVPDAYRLAHAWTYKLNRSFERNQDVAKDIDGISILHEFPNGFKINSQYSYQREGAKMGHCVSSYHNKPNSIFSLRDANNDPHCTIEYDPVEQVVYQIKGKGNGRVSELYQPLIISFLNSINCNKIYDTNNLKALNLGTYLLDITQPIPDTITINKTVLFEKIKLDFIFNELVINGDFKIHSIRGQKKTSKKNCSEWRFTN
jgi:hypothetical protein